jgi:hypothetical protein
VKTVTTISSITSLPQRLMHSGDANTTQQSTTTSNPLMGSRQNDGYQSLGGALVRNSLIGAGLGLAIGLPTGIGAPIGAGIGAVVGAGSTLIRQPRVANAVGDGMKAAMAGAAGGALVGVVTPFGPVGGAVAGAVGGFVTGTVSGLLKKVAGGKYSIEGQTTVMGRVTHGLMLGAASGGVIGAGAGLLFGGIGAVPGAFWGAMIGGIGGAAYGLMSGGVDAATGAKGVRFSGGGSSLPGLPHLGSGSGSTGQVGQDTTQSVTQVA